jgi:hypothetical protein
MFLSKNALPLLTIFGGALQATAQIAQGRREAELFEFNASVEKQKAFLIGERNKLDLEQQRRQARQFKATQIATIGASGVRATGSPLAVVEDSATEFIKQQNLTDFNARVEQLSALNAAEFNLQKAQIAKSSSFIKAGQSLLNTLPAFGKLKFAKSSVTSGRIDGVSSESFLSPDQTNRGFA